MKYWDKKGEVKRVLSVIRLFIFCILSTFLVTSNLTAAAENIVAHQDWKVLETKHFRIHYTIDYRNWAISAAYDMEASAEILKKQQQRWLQEKVDVVVFDPLNDSNGFAIPFSNKPIMALFATPPLSDSLISNSNSWQQLLSLHEYVHLVHIAQPDRSQLHNSISKYWDLYDIFRAASMPRWVTEGYATLQESKLTGRGRVYDVQVEAFLLQFAREGALPIYSELSDTEGRYRIGNMAYLVGARFLTWLEQNYSEQSLDAVWTRLRAIESRSFEDAFEGVFLETPEYLYQRFSAEYTYKALASEKQFQKNKSQIWYDANYDLTAPALSPDHKYLAMVETNKKGDSKLRVISTNYDASNLEKFNNKNQTILENDPDDIIDNQPKLFKPKTKYSLSEFNFSGIRNPRWRNNNQIIFGAKTTDKYGNYHQDLFQWTLSSGDIELLTMQANVRRFDIEKNGKWLIAEQSKNGYSGLIKLNLYESEGKLVLANKGLPLTSSRLDHIYDFPRINPKNPHQFAYLKSTHNTPWTLYLRDLTNPDGEDIQVPMPKDYQFLSFPNWSTDGNSLYFVAGQQGKLQVYSYQVDKEGQLFEVTNGAHPVSWPMEVSNEELFENKQSSPQLMQVSTRSRGPEIYIQPIEHNSMSSITEFADLTNFEYLKQNTTSKYLMPDAGLNTDISIGEESDYKFGRQDVTFTLTGADASSSFGVSEFGIKGGDLLQKLNWNVNLAVSAYGELESGYSANIEWQGWPVEIKAHLYSAKLDLSGNTSYRNLYPNSYQKTQQLEGGYLSASYPYRFNSWSLSNYKGVFSTSFNLEQDNQFEKEIISLKHSQSWFVDKVNWGLIQSSKIQLLSGNTQGVALSEDWRGTQGHFTFGGHIFGIGLKVTQQFAKRFDSEVALITLGGLETNVINSEAHLSWILQPELSLGFQQGNDYSNQKLSLYQRGGSFEFYYSTPKMAGSNLAKITGFSSKMNLNLLGSGLTNLQINFGMADVKITNDHNFEGWISALYKF